MDRKTAEKLELDTGCKSMEFDGADGLFVFFEPRYKKRIAVAGTHGMTDLTAKQALALADGLRDIVSTYMEINA